MHLTFTASPRCLCGLLVLGGQKTVRHQHEAADCGRTPHTAPIPSTFVDHSIYEGNQAQDLAKPNLLVSAAAPEKQRVELSQAAAKCRFDGRFWIAAVLGMLAISSQRWGLVVGRL